MVLINEDDLALYPRMHDYPTERTSTAHTHFNNVMALNTVPGGGTPGGGGAPGAGGAPEPAGTGGS